MDKVSGKRVSAKGDAKGVKGSSRAGRAVPSVNRDAAGRPKNTDKAPLNSGQEAKER